MREARRPEGGESSRARESLADGREWDAPTTAKYARAPRGKTQPSKGDPVPNRFDRHCAAAERVTQRRALARHFSLTVAVRLTTIGTVKSKHVYVIDILKTGAPQVHHCEVLKYRSNPLRPEVYVRPVNGWGDVWRRVWFTKKADAIREAKRIQSRRENDRRNEPMPSRPRQGRKRSAA